MLKVIHTLGVVLLLNTIVLAQPYKMLSFRAGGGLSATTFPTAATAISGQNNSQKATTVATYMAGIGLNIPIAGRLSFQPELTYIRKGYGLDYTQNGVKATGTYFFNYIEVPLFVKIAFASDRFRFFAFAGPSVGYGLNGKFDQKAVSGANTISQAGKVVFGEGQSTSSIQYYSKNSFQQLDIGAQGGIAVGTRVGTGLFLLELRGGFGLTDFSKNEESKFRAGMIALSYGIPLGSVGNAQ